MCFFQGHNNMDSPDHLVCVVDDDAGVREAIALLVKTLGWTCRTFDSCVGLLEDPCLERCDCLVLDVRLPGMTGLELQMRLLETQKVVPVIFISGHGDIPMAVRAMRLGALDFLQKPFDDDCLILGIRRAIARSVLHRQRRLDCAAAAAKLASLTSRERGVLDLLRQGLINKVVADRLDISVRTVEQHRGRIMSKMGAHTMAELLNTLALSEDGAGGQPRTGGVGE